MIDRLWSQWQIGWTGSEPSFAVLDAVLRPFSMRVPNLLRIDQLGYEYADVAVSGEPVVERG